MEQYNYSEEVKKWLKSKNNPTIRVGPQYQAIIPQFKPRGLKTPTTDAEDERYESRDEELSQHSANLSQSNSIPQTIPEEENKSEKIDSQFKEPNDRKKNQEVFIHSSKQEQNEEQKNETENQKNQSTKKYFPKNTNIDNLEKNSENIVEIEEVSPSKKRKHEEIKDNETIEIPPKKTKVENNDN